MIYANMMFFKSLLSLSALLALVSAMTLERNGKSYSEVGHLGTITHTVAAGHSEITIIVDSKPAGFKGTRIPSYSSPDQLFLMITQVHRSWLLNPIARRRMRMTARSSAAFQSRLVHAVPMETK
jgi:hypothetical protein